MAKVKETSKQKLARKILSTPESRYQGMLNAKRTYAIHKKTSAKARKRKA